MNETKKRLIARVAHEANRQYCKGNGIPSREPWSDLSTDQEQSLITAVGTVAENDDIQAPDLHEIWMKAKKEEGYTYGAVDDHANKVSSALRPFSELPQHVQIKDELFIGIVRALSGSAPMHASLKKVNAELAQANEKLSSTQATLTSKVEEVRKLEKVNEELRAEMATKVKSLEGQIEGLKQRLLDKGNDE